MKKYGSVHEDNDKEKGKRKCNLISLFCIVYVTLSAHCPNPKENDCKK
jgi:hypothetical protein